MNKKSHAQQLYMRGCISQKEIAEAVGVSDRTIWTWVHQYAWDKLRLAACQAPLTITDNICSQVVELQNAIARKEPGCRYPNAKEAEIMRKLIVMLDKMKRTPSLSQNMQMLETFRNYVRPLDKDFAKKLGNYSEQFLESKSVNGYAPYQAEYGVEPVLPIDPSIPEEDLPAAAEENQQITEDTAMQPCADINSCRHEGQCSFPKCLHPERFAAPVDPTSRYRIPAIHYKQSMLENQEIAAHLSNREAPTASGNISAEADVFAGAEEKPKFPETPHRHNANSETPTDSYKHARSSAPHPTSGAEEKPKFLYSPERSIIINKPTDTTAPAENETEVFSQLAPTG